MKVTPANQARVRKLVLKEYQKLVDCYVKPLTNLPIGIDLDIEVKEEYFVSSAAIGHPNFGWFGLQMKGIVVSSFGRAVAITPDVHKAFLHGFAVVDGKVSHSIEVGSVQSDIRTIALLANKVSGVREILSTLEIDKEALVTSLNEYLVLSTSGA